MQQPSQPEHSSKLPLLISLGLLLALVAAYFLSPGFAEEVDTGWAALTSGEQSRLADWVRQYGWWGPLVVVLAMVAQMFLFVVPSVLLMVVAVIAYGPWWGGLLAVTAVLAASTVGYWIGVWLGPLTVDRLVGGRSRQRVSGYIERYGAWTVVAVRISPLLSNDAISLVGGLLRMGFWRFLLATLAGILPLAGSIAVMGQSYRQLEWVLGGISLVSLLALGMYIWWEHRKGSAD